MQIAYEDLGQFTLVLNGGFNRFDSAVMPLDVKMVAHRLAVSRKAVEDEAACFSEGSVFPSMAFEW